MLWLLGEAKTTVVYFAPEKRFFNLRAQDDLVGMLLKCDDETLEEIDRKISLPNVLKRMNRRQTSLDLSSSTHANRH